MKAELREQLGKAVFKEYYERIVNTIAPETKDVTWEQQWGQTEEKVKDLYRLEGEAAVSSFVQTIMPMVMQVKEIVVPMMGKSDKELLESAMTAILIAVEE